MGLIKMAIIGAAVAYGINHITKKREDGTSILDDLTNQAPEWMDKAKQYATQAVNDVRNQGNPNRPYPHNPPY